MSNLFAQGERGHNLIPAILIALPLIMLGLFAAHNLQLEYSARSVNLQRDGVEVLHKTEAALNEAVTSQLKSLIKQVEKIANQNSINELRQFTVSRKTIFLLIYKKNQQLFPPPETNAVSYAEKVYLNLLVGVLANARQRMSTGLSFQASIYIPSDNQNAQLFCERSTQQLDICVLQLNSELWPSVYEKIRSLNPQQWHVELRQQNNNEVLPDGAVEKIMSEAMDGHKLIAVPKNEPSSLLRRVSSLAAITLPLFVSWILLSWYFYRKQRLNFLEKQKSAELSAQLSHELRTPLANLALYLDLTQRRADHPNAVLGYVQTMQHELDRLSVLSNSAIAVAQGQQVKVKRETVIADDIIAKLLNRYSTLFLQSGCTIKFTGNAQQVIIIDQIALESILLQLLDNACKYAGGGIIEVLTVIKNNNLEIKIKDVGQGFRDDLQEKIFNIGFREHEAPSKGYGIGLSAVRNLARLNNGDVVAENTYPGACFTVTLRIGEYS